MRILRSVPFLLHGILIFFQCVSLHEQSLSDYYCHHFFPVHSPCGPTRDGFGGGVMQ